MSGLKRFLLGILIGTMTMEVTGCGATEALVQDTISELTEFPKFIQEPERTITEIELPRTYIIEETDMPVLRNQEDTNGCWAFASLSALESSKDIDSVGPYSADHLIYQNPFDLRFENGGSYLVTVSYLLSWKGPVLEETDSFDGQSTEGLEPCAHVQEIRFSQPKDYEVIKRFIYLYGGVESALYMDFEDSVFESQYYNDETNSFCYTGTEISNHDIVIVGWDDDYPAENFVGEVTENGAFLCQNSWGESFGNQGTFFVSYEDVNIGGYGVVYTQIDAVDNYDKIFQSDLCGFTAQIGYEQESCWFANAYTAEENISVKAAGFYATGEYTEYEVYLVSDFEGVQSFKEKEYVCNGFLEDAGYYTIDFPKEVSIEEGKDFAVVVKITTEDAEYPVAIEYPVKGLSENMEVSDGRGYLSLQGNLWENVEDTNGYNICLKAYADLQ